MPHQPSYGATATTTAAFASHGQRAQRQRIVDADVPNTQRTIQVWESAFNASKLNEYHWNFQIAKSVNNADKTTFNVVWQSKSVAPSTLIVWHDVYGLNWTAAVPAPGVSVTISGKWQTCALGESYDLDTNGFWKSSTTTGDSKYMNVGKIDYKYPDVDGIHIVIGVANDSGSFDIIYVDPTALPPGSTAKYQPQERVEWWYQTGIRTSTMISDAATAKGGVDLSAPAPTTAKYYYSTTYNYDSGTWLTSEDKPPGYFYQPAQNIHRLTDVPVGLISIWSADLKVSFDIALSESQQATASGKLDALLSLTYKDVKVSVVNSLTWDVSIGAPKRARPNSNDVVGVATDKIIAEVGDLLKYERDEGYLPRAETWKIKKIAQ